MKKNQRLTNQTTTMPPVKPKKMLLSDILKAADIDKISTKNLIAFSLIVENRKITPKQLAKMVNLNTNQLDNYTRKLKRQELIDVAREDSGYSYSLTKSGRELVNAFQMTGGGK